MFVPGRCFRINKFSGLMNRPLVYLWKSVPALSIRTREISGLSDSEPGLTNHHCRYTKNLLLFTVSLPILRLLYYNSRSCINNQVIKCLYYFTMKFWPFVCHPLQIALTAVTFLPTDDSAPSKQELLVARKYWTTRPHMARLINIKRGRSWSPSSTFAKMGYCVWTVFIPFNREQHLHLVWLGLVYWWFYVTVNSISVVFVTAHRCASGLKKKVDRPLGHQDHWQFIGFFKVPVHCEHRAILSVL